MAAGCRLLIMCFCLCCCCTLRAKPEPRMPYNNSRNSECKSPCNSSRNSSSISLPAAYQGNLNVSQPITLQGALNVSPWYSLKPSMYVTLQQFKDRQISKQQTACFWIAWLMYQPLKMEAVHSSKSVLNFYQSIWYSILHSHHNEYCKSFNH